MKKNTLFIWGKKQVEAMDLLQLSLITPLVLIFLDYTEKVNDIILAVDASFDWWEELLIQLVQAKKHLFRYEGGI